MWSAIEYDLREQGVAIDRSGMTGRVCETYPTAALAAWGLPKRKPSLELIESAFPFLRIPDQMRPTLDSDDTRDAVVCSLVARARTLDLTVEPQHLQLARREGWIHISTRDPRSLLSTSSTGKWLSAPLHVPTEAELAEDGPKKTFDFWRSDGTQIDILREFADFIGEGPRQAAERIVRYAYPAAIPSRLSKEAWELLVI